MTTTHTPGPWTVFVQHTGTPATKAHDVGVLTLAQCLRRFVGMNERGWSTFDAEWVTRLCREGGRYAHFYFAPQGADGLADEARAAIARATHA